MIAGALVVTGIVLARSFSSSAPAPTTSAPVLSIQQVGLLQTLHVQVADVRKTQIQGHLGDATLLLILRGDAAISVDLTQAQIETVDRHATITLPPPTVTHARVDADASNVYRIDRTGLWLLRPDDALTATLVNQALADAQQTIRTTASKPELLDLARRQAEQLIAHHATTLGHTAEIHWRNPP